MMGDKEKKQGDTAIWIHTLALVGKGLRLTSIIFEGSEEITIVPSE